MSVWNQHQQNASNLAWRRRNHTGGCDEILFCLCANDSVFTDELLECILFAVLWGHADTEYFKCGDVWIRCVI